VTDAYMTVGVKHAFIDKDPIGQSKLAERCLINVGG
jgi:hypothetical protein